MSVLGGVNRISPRQLLFDWRAEDRSLNPRTGQVLPFTRASLGAVLDQNGVYSIVPNNAPRLGIVGGNFGLLLEGGRTESALGSNSFANGAYWAGDTDFTIATATSCIAGQVASKHTNNNVSAFRARGQSIGTFVNGQTDCFYVILENTNAVTTAIGIFDSTASAQVHLVDFTWSTKTVATTAGSGTKGVVALGNGRYLVWITATGTAAGTGQAGHTRTALCYVTGGTQNGFTTTLHHAQFEANASYPTTPIVTVGSTLARSTDVMFGAFLAAIQAVTVYDNFVWLGGTMFKQWRYGTGSAYLQWAVMNGTQTLTHYDGSTTANASRAVALTAGDLVELRGVTGATGTMQLNIATNSGAESSSAPSAALAYVAAAGSPQIDFAAGSDFSIVQKALRIATGSQSLASMQTLDLN
jgi:hypothetical protein